MQNKIQSYFADITGSSNLMFAALNFGFRAFNNLVVFVLLVRVIGLSSFGLLSYLITIITTLSILSDFGYGYYIVKEVSINPKSINYDFIANKIVLKVIIFSFIFCLLTVYLYNKNNLEIPLWSILVFCSSGFFITFSHFSFSFFYSIGKFYLESTCLSFFTVFLIIGTILTWYTGRMRWFMLCYWLGSICMMLGSIFFFYKEFKLSILGIVKYFFLYKVSKEFRVIFPFAIITIIDNLLNSVDIIILEAYASKQDLGIYFGCIKITMALSIASAIASSAFMPIISKILGAPTRKGLIKILRVFGGLLIVGAGISVTYLIFSQHIINLLYGENFSKTSNYEIAMFNVQIVLIAFSRYLISIPSIYLIASNNHLIRVYILVSTLILSTLNYLYFVPVYGIIATINIMTVMNIALLLLYIFFCIPSFIFEYKKYAGVS